MGRPISVPQRQVIFEKATLGHGAGEIASDLELNPETVRKLIARFRKAGVQCLAPDYSRCGLKQPRRVDAGLIEAAMAMRRQHPSWGAGIIRVRLAEQHPGPAVPGVRAIQRGFAEAGLNPAPTGRRCDGPGRRAERPHQTWQLDAADQMRLADGRMASWLRVVDECSGAFLVTVVFPPRVLEHRAGSPDPGRPPGCVRGLGDAGTDPGGQRHAQEIQGGPAHRPGTLADRAGRRGESQPAAPSPGQRRGGTLAGHRQTLVRAAPGRLGGGTPGDHRCHGSPSARVLSLPRSGQPPGGASGSGAFGAVL